MALVTKWYNYNNYDDLIEALGTHIAPVLSALVDYVMTDLLRNMYGSRTQWMAKWKFWMTKIVYSICIKVNHWIILVITLSFKKVTEYRNIKNEC